MCFIEAEAKEKAKDKSDKTDEKKATPDKSTKSDGKSR